MADIDSCALPANLKFPPIVKEVSKIWLFLDKIIKVEIHIISRSLKFYVRCPTISSENHTVLTL
jgi:hypothetical protein